MEEECASAYLSLPPLPLLQVLVAVSSQDARIYVFSARSGALLRTLETSQGEGALCCAVALGAVAGLPRAACGGLMLGSAGGYLSSVDLTPPPPLLQPGKPPSPPPGPAWDDRPATDQPASFLVLRSRAFRRRERLLLLLRRPHPRALDPLARLRLPRARSRAIPGARRIAWLRAAPASRRRARGGLPRRCVPFLPPPPPYRSLHASPRTPSDSGDSRGGAAAVGSDDSVLQVCACECVVCVI